jgi:hypothetical protein
MDFGLDYQFRNIYKNILNRNQEESFIPGDNNDKGRTGQGVLF